MTTSQKKTVSNVINFYDHIVPRLKAGSYELSVSQTLKEQENNNKVPEDSLPPIKQTFQVRGPRFSLDPSDIQHVFPSRNGLGTYHSYLPNVVFNKRSLPWERNLKLPATVKNPDQIPWVALLILTSDEIIEPQSNSNETSSSTTFPLNEVVQGENPGPPKNTRGPKLKDRLEEDENPAEIHCSVLDISVDTFVNLIPNLEELPFLSHVREVSTENKKDLKMTHEGWFSVLMSNRFASPPPQTEGAQIKNYAHIVSLEGFEDLLSPKGVEKLEKIDKIRLISLYSWTYTCQADPQDNFKEIMSNLISSQSEKSTDLLLRLPPPCPKTKAQEQASKKLSQGYVPLGYTMLSGEETFAWYRGPFSPVPTKRFLKETSPDQTENPKTPMTASQAMIYDSSTGLFDQSYAVAWQTGRSLALANKTFVTNLMQWRRQAHGMVNLLLERIRSPHLNQLLRKESLLNESGRLNTAGIKDLAELLDANLFDKAFKDFMAGEFATEIAHRIGSMGGFSDEDSYISPSEPDVKPKVPTGLINLMKENAVIDLLHHLSGFKEGVKDTHFECPILPEQITQWLARLSLLQNVPFNNIIPDSRLLPRESIRFFYLDRNWTDSLLDGALSIGIQSTRDSLFHQLMRDPLYRSVDSVIESVRRNFVEPSSKTATQNMAGFILRSSAVLHWPGLEILAYGEDPEIPLKPLRLDQVSSDVMIGLFPEIPKQVVFNEPAEGLVFGVQDEGIPLRYVPGISKNPLDLIGKMIDPSHKTKLIPPKDIPYRDSPKNNPPLSLKEFKTGESNNYRGLVHNLEKLLFENSKGLHLTPASFAVEMLHVAEQMVFKRKEG